MNNKRLIVFLTFFIIFFTINIVYGASKYDNLMSSKNGLEEINAQANINNATTAAKAIAILSQNQEAVNNFLNDISGRNYNNLRSYIGIDASGNVEKGKEVQALYTIAYIIDTNNEYLKSGVETSAEGFYNGYYMNEISDSYLHQNLLGSSIYDSDFDKSTTGHILDLSNSGNARDELLVYYSEKVDRNVPGSIGANYDQYGINYILYDENGDNGNLNITIGSGETISGNTTTEFNENAGDILKEKLDVAGNDQVKDNFENVTGIDLDKSVDGTATIGNFVASFDINKILEDASKFFSDAIHQRLDSELDSLVNIFPGIIQAIFQIGNLVILASIVFTGIRYVFSGINGKAAIKESLINISAGVIFFYVAQGLYDFAHDFLVGMIADTTNINNISTSVWGNVALIAKILSILGLAIVGIRYMLANAEIKMDIKKQLLPVVIGLILIYCVTSFTQFIIDSSSEALGDVEHTDVETISEGNEDTELKSAALRIYSTAALIIQILAVFALIATGLRYMFANANTKANIKGQCIILAVGAMLVFGTVEIIKSLKLIGEDVLDTSYVIERKL